VFSLITKSTPLTNQQNYRMRKKEYLSELKARIQQLEQEKEQLTKENMAHKLNSNTTVTQQTVDPAIVAGLNGIDFTFLNLSSLLPMHILTLLFTEVARALNELDMAIQTQAEDRIVEYYMQTFFLAAGKLHSAFLKDIDELVNPFTQVNLASLGYITSIEYPEVSSAQVGTWWDSFIASSNLTPDQTTKLREVIDKLCKRDCELRMEREVLDKQVKQFYLNKLMIVPLMNTTTKPTEQLDGKTILDFTWLLNRLKTNIIQQKSLLLNTQPLISAILTPRQHASLVLTLCHSRFFEWPYHAQVLRAAWDMVSRSTSEVTTISQNHPLTPLSPYSSPSVSPYSSPYSPSYDTASPPQYLAPASPSTLVPSLAIPTPTGIFPTQFTTLAPSSPNLTPSCTLQLSSSSLVQSFLSSLNNPGVY
jgi:hypothetical protein